MRAIIQERRDTLQAEQDRAELAYARLDEQRKQIKQDLALLGRKMDIRHGAIQALDELLALPGEEQARQASDYVGSADARAHADMMEYFTAQEPPCDSPASSS